MFHFSGSDTPSAPILLLFLNLPTQCCQKHLSLLPPPHTPLLSCSVSKTGPLSAYLSAPIISKLQSCSDFHFSCLTATPSCTVLSMESSAILPHLCNIPSSASFPFAHLYSLPLVYPLGNDSSHLPFFQSRYLYDNTVVTRFYLLFCTPPPLTFCSLLLKYYALLCIFYTENTKPHRIWKPERLGECARILLEVNDNRARWKTNLTWTELLTQQNEAKTKRRKAKHELVCLKRGSERLRDAQRYDSFAHISWFKTRKTGDLHSVVVQRTRIV